MKLVFKKDNTNQINVFQRVNGEERDFSYVDMIKALLEFGKLEPPNVGKGFSDAETRSIESMVSSINKAISTTEESGNQGQPSG